MNKTDFAKPNKRLPVIDFLRGYSIFTIVLMHLVQSYTLPSWMMKVASFGGAGVHCSSFAVGSGSTCLT